MTWVGGIFFGVAIGVLIGAKISDWCTNSHIKEKGLSGFRMAVGGELYWIVPSSKEDCECQNHMCAAPVQFPGAGYCLKHGLDMAEGRKEKR